MKAVQEKLVFAGESTAGHRQLVCAYIGQPFQGECLFYKEKNQELWIAEKAGQQEDNQLALYSDINKLFIAFSTANKKSFSAVEDKWLAEIKKYCKNVPVVLVGVRASGDKTKDAVTETQANELAQRIKAQYIECDLSLKYTISAQGIALVTLPPAPALVKQGSSLGFGSLISRSPTPARDVPPPKLLSWQEIVTKNPPSPTLTKQRSFIGSLILGNRTLPPAAAASATSVDYSVIRDSNVEMMAIYNNYLVALLTERFDVKEGSKLLVKMRNNITKLCDALSKSDDKNNQLIAQLPVAASGLRSAFLQCQSGESRQAAVALLSEIKNRWGDTKKPLKEVTIAKQRDGKYCLTVANGNREGGRGV